MLTRRMGAAGVALFAAATAYAQIGPDVIVGDIQETAKWTQRNGITAFSLGTTSCNIGDQNLDWVEWTNQHPVIGQNLYRLKDGRFEQIGQSWLKHGFFALSQTLCFTDCQGTDGTSLGVHCSDPYSAGLNGNQFNLGPRSEVNASTGYFPYPYGDHNVESGLSFRLQVHNTDLNPELNSGAMYFAEGQYVHPDDASFENDDNNASYRRVNIAGVEPNYSLVFVTGHPTQREKAAILAWEDFDPAVKTDYLDVPDDGRFIIAYKASDNGDGTFHYEYAVQNLNSHRSARSFMIPLPQNVNITNVGYHDVDSHSGDGVDGGVYSNVDWAATVGEGFIMWEAETYNANHNANALRWGTLYNFRFDADLPPGAAVATVGLFRPGSPNSMNIGVNGPVGGSSVPCDGIKKFAASCNVSTGRVIAKIVTFGTGYDGYSVGLSIDGNSGYATISGKKAKFSRIVTGQDHVVELTDPASCKAPINATCQ
ncbi:MAG: hypothetical protein IT449_09045 [Phycisphaerales bacterium]|nr:hypothetical protein [Phycisphaerales bacterium]